MKRIDCLKVLAGITRENDLVVTNLGNTPHEWQSVRPSRANLYGMNLGECTPVALGLALALPNRRVIALDGDGNLLLNLASLADTAYHNPGQSPDHCLRQSSLRIARGYADRDGTWRRSGADCQRMRDSQELHRCDHRRLRRQDQALRRRRVLLSGGKNRDRNDREAALCQPRL